MTDRCTDICDSRVTFTTENISSVNFLILERSRRTSQNRDTEVANKFIVPCLEVVKSNKAGNWNDNENGDRKCLNKFCEK